MSKCTPVTEAEFIKAIKLHIEKQGTYPLELITFLKSTTGKKLIAIPDYGSGTLYLDKDYASYKTALTRVGAIMDKIDYPAMMITRKKCRPLSYTEFYLGYTASEDASNPYAPDSSDFSEWQQGFDNQD